MYKISKKYYGFHLTFSGEIGVDEMSQWVQDSKTALTTAPNEFSVFVDMRDLKLLDEETQGMMETGQKLYKGKGLQRSVVVLNSAILTMQFMRIAKETGIYQWERYIDASSISDWEQVGINWLVDKKDPDA